MDFSPYDFIVNHRPKDLKPLEKFKHRTFNATDTLYFIAVLKKMYHEFGSMEEIFLQSMNKEDFTIEKALKGFHQYFFSFPDYPERTRKHIATPARNSACKRLNMFLRWMVRKDACGVDFGLWQNIRPDQLVCPCDVHVERISRRYGLINRNGVNWNTALDLTGELKKFDATDPVKYDFALFGLGIEQQL
jgi:uncharacterized protein (TIGR02757 family)